MKIIELLDGSTWDMDTVLAKMQDDSFYYGNLSKNALSSSACKLLLTSPKTYHYVTKYGSEDSDAFAVGRLVHLMALEPHKVEEYEVIEVQSKNAKAWQEAKGKRNICTRKEYNEAQRIADALLRNENVLGLITGCEFEVPKIGMIGGLPFRAKADIYADGFFADIKTTTKTCVPSLIQLADMVMTYKRSSTPVCLVCRLTSSTLSLLTRRVLISASTESALNS
jgi:hypothetical protein